MTERSYCQYVEEFPLQALPQFSSLSGHEVPEHGLLILVMQYGKKKIDYLGAGRAVTDWSKAWKSNFLHLGHSMEKPSVFCNRHSPQRTVYLLTGIIITIFYSWKINSCKQMRYSVRRIRK